MDCSAARDWLLQAEWPGRLDDGPDGLAAHVVRCPDCQRLARRLEALELEHRARPLPTGAELARERFLAGLPSWSPPVSRRRHVRPRWALAAAAALLLASGVLWLLRPAAPAPTPDVVDQLIAWNLDLTGAPEPGDRQRLLDRQAEPLRQAVRQADLPEGDRDLAEALLQTGAVLAADADPMTQADRFDALADHLVALIDQATNKKDARRLRKLADYYRRIAVKGIDANLDRAGQEEPLKGERKKKRDRVLKQQEARAARLARLLERAPKAARKEIRRALGAESPDEK
jgi:hypothetical protein